MNLVEVEQIKGFLKKTYDFSSENIELMLASIKESLTLEFANVERGLVEDDNTLLWRAAHSIKGALLNAGVENWAEVARKIELSAKNKEEVDYEGLFKELKMGINNIL